MLALIISASKNTRNPMLSILRPYTGTKNPRPQQLHWVWIESYEETQNCAIVHSARHGCWICMEPTGIATIAMEIELFCLINKYVSILIMEMMERSRSPEQTDCKWKMPPSHSIQSEAFQHIDLPGFTATLRVLREFSVSGSLWTLSISWIRMNSICKIIDNWWKYSSCKMMINKILWKKNGDVSVFNPLALISPIHRRKLSSA